MTTNLTPEQRTAPSADAPTSGPVTLINCFTVAPDRDDAFYALWNTASQYFRAQPGFISLRLHRAVNADAGHRWINVANWASDADFRAAHGTDEFRKVVTLPGWQEFPSLPVLYEVATAVG